MSKITRNLLIGEKIGFGFGLVGLIFLIVIWQYHNTLQQSLGDYQQLQNVFVAKKVDMLTLESSMRAARHAEKEFLLYRDEELAREVDRHLQQTLVISDHLAGIDADSADMTKRITELLEIYQQKFRATEHAWRERGLDHNSGLQGTFRNAAHELEAMAGHFKVDSLYLQLLQIRRAEKDLGLRREQQYLTQVLDLIQEFERKTAASELEEGVKTRLFHEIEVYRETFGAYARAALASADIHGGKGPFREAAHRIEAILNHHHVPELANHILQLRRHEKDYLLRNDKKYVDMALQELDRIQMLVEAASISNDQKAIFLSLLKNYHRDYLALVDQNDHVERMTGEMQSAVSEITQLVRENVATANQVMESMQREISISSAEKERFMLWSVVVATLLGIVFAVSITLRIVRPLRSMTGILDRLAYEESTERLPFYPDARDEINAMAISVNTMADNRSRFIAWWENAMSEADACKNLESVLNKGADDPQKEDAERQFRAALAARHELLYQQYHKLHALNGTVIKKVDALQQEGYSGQTYIDISTIRYSSRSMQNILEMIAFQDNQEKTAG